MNLKLVKLQSQHKLLLENMLDEWYASCEDIVPYSIYKNDYHDFETYLQNLDVKIPTNGLVPDSTFFCIDTDRNIFVGAVNIRHYLSDKLLLCGGHVGDGVRPSERKKALQLR